MSSNFSISHELVIETPEPSRGFPVSDHEWEKLKNKVGLLQKKRSFLDSFGWKDIGMVFFGITLTTFVSFWLPGYSEPSQQKMALIIMGFSFLFGVCCTLFQYQLASKEDDNINTNASNIIELMDLIEKNHSNQTKKEQ